MINDVKLKNGKGSTFSKIPKNETNKNLQIEILVNRYVFVNAWESLHIPKKLVTWLTPGGTLGTYRKYTVKHVCITYFKN